MKEKLGQAAVILIVIMVITVLIAACVDAQKQENRYPKVGDTIIFNNTKVVIMDVKFWSDPKIYTIRLPDWSTAKILKTELLDMEPEEK